MPGILDFVSTKLTSRGREATSSFDFPSEPTETLGLAQRQVIVDFARVMSSQFLTSAAEQGLYNPQMYPVDIDAIAKGLGIKGWLGELDDKDGVIVKDVGERLPQLALSRNASPESQLFTFAHELGHWEFFVLDKTDQEIVDAPFFDNCWKNEGDKIPKEYFANSFAHFTLMPTEEVIACILSGKTFEDMQRHFGVSKEAMQRRFSYFDLERQSFDVEPVKVTAANE